MSIILLMLSIVYTLCMRAVVMSSNDIVILDKLIYVSIIPENPLRMSCPPFRAGGAVLASYIKRR